MVTRPQYDVADRIGMAISVGVVAGMSEAPALPRGTPG